MEISIVRSCSHQSKIIRNNIVVIQEVGFCKNHTLFKKNKICFGQTYKKISVGRRRSQLIVKAIQFENSSLQALNEGEISPLNQSEGVRLFVGLPLDCVSSCNSLNHIKAIVAGLKALKLLGVEGVEFPIWWGIVERETMGDYEWSTYLALAEMIRDMGFKIQISLCFHGNKEVGIELPQWVTKIGEDQPDIYFTDRSGRRYKECLSLAIDELPVLNEKTGIQVYQSFMESFKSSFSSLIGTTITDIRIGLGPDGELRYPSHRNQTSQNNKTMGVGEFQCYDKHMMNNLKEHSMAMGNENWGLSGPHDTPTYEQSLNSNNFFKENGGSWETRYGDFFLSWYSNNLVRHCNHILSLSTATFGGSHVNLLAKIPLTHSWYKTRSHPSELTAGFYNTDKRDGYDSIAEVLERNSCNILLPGMDLVSDERSQESLSSPELLLSQIKKSCMKYGVKISGENSSVSGTLGGGGFDQIKKNLGTETFTYHRMGAYFFSPEHFPGFTKFVRNLDRSESELHSDDMPSNEGNFMLAEVSESRKKLEMIQVA